MEERRSYVRFPITLFVDRIDFEPEVYVGTEVRTAYDLEITEYDIRKLHTRLTEHLNIQPVAPVRIRVIGRLVS